MAGEEKVTHLEYLEDLSKGNSKFVHDMIGIFLEENPQEVAALGKGIESHDFALIRTSAHKMRSTIPFVGIDRLLEDDITEVESMATSHMKPDELTPGVQQPQEDETSALKKISERFEKIRKVCEQACRELAQLQGQSGR